MTINAELARWGEPPVSVPEEALIALLDRVLERRALGEKVRLQALLADAPELLPEGEALLQAVGWLEQFIADVLERSGVEEMARPAAGGTTAWAAGGHELPQVVPGEFRVLKRVGAGSFSTVWLADDCKLGIPVALKTLHFHVSGGARALALAALENEARVLARLQHPNVVRVYSLRQTGGEHYLVLQYVAGGSLQARLDHEGPLGWRRAARYLADVGEGLLEAHTRGIVHRDVKLANMLWDPDRDEALLTDFGLAGRLADGGEVAGTPLYMAPEAFEGLSTPAGDVYGLAASLFTLVTGRVPFPAATRQELRERIGRGLPDTEPLFAGVPERLERVIRAGLAAAPERRPGLRAFVADLRGSLNRLLADALVLPEGPASRTAPVDLRLTVARWEGGNTYMPVAGTHPAPVGVTRNLTKVPPLPRRVGLRTGDRVRIEVVADRTGFLTVFNVGPTGHLTLLYPDPAPATEAAAPVPADRPLHVTDVALTPPAGDERLVAVWSRGPLSLEKALELTRGDQDAVSPPYRATRDMERVQASVQQLRPEDWHAVVLELGHDA
jgi:tRNA A-37 threonylcarbamoyl transferase component Bud32